MARTGKKSIKSKPSSLKKSIVENRKIRKQHRDKALLKKLDGELDSTHITNKTRPGKKLGSKEGDDELVTSFDQLRGL